ncbi:hypothetical protein [Streptomyces rubiginosohelvolus]|uniref:hypothetical protein n=1 Tax=Streptomyces rubiginosohelvolus TaxID=67362 RepID=UPI0035E1C39C
MRLLRLMARRPRPAALFAAGLATALLGTVGVLGTDAPAAPAAEPAPGVTVALPGDDNADGRIDEDESGWDCRTMGNRLCGGDVPPECERAGDSVQLCVTVAARAPYGWTNADGSTVDVPDGRAMIRDLDETPGTAPWADALAALDAEYREHAPRA